MLDKKLTLASLLCKPFQYSLIELQILRREASHRLLFRWQFNLSVKKVRLIFPAAMDHGLTDAIFSGDFRVIFNSFCFGDYIKFKHEVVRRVTSLGHDDNLTWNKWLQTRACLIDATDVYIIWCYQGPPFPFVMGRNSHCVCLCTLFFHTLVDSHSALTLRFHNEST